MRAPDFWWTSPDARALRAQLLRPLGALYAGLTARRMAQTGYRSPLPVICVGNINAGGTGKTPTAMALLMAFSAKGVKAHVVSRGYGGSLAGPVQVEERRHSAADVGDEPLLLSAFAPVWVAHDRAAGVKAAESAGAEVVILDDGFQNPSVAKDLSIVVVDAQVGFGNGLCLPAGPLREPVAVGLARADAVISIGNEAAQAKFAAEWGAALQGLPHLRAALLPLPTGMPWQGLRVMAFAGIGRPDKVFATLRDLGADLAKTVALDDHQPLSPALLQRMQAQAEALGARLVTTEKDAMRLPHAQRASILTLPVRLAFAPATALDTLVAPVIAQVLARR